MAEKKEPMPRRMIQPPSGRLRFVSAHPCSVCGKPVWGSRKRCTDCWEGLPDSVRQKIVEKAMDNDLTFDAAWLRARPFRPPKIRRLPARPYDEQP